jgi:hypothetical protein
MKGSGGEAELKRFVVGTKAEGVFSIDLRKREEVEGDGEGEGDGEERIVVLENGEGREIEVEHKRDLMDKGDEDWGRRQLSNNIVRFGKSLDYTRRFLDNNSEKAGEGLLVCLNLFCLFLAVEFLEERTEAEV